MGHIIQYEQASKNSSTRSRWGRKDDNTLLVQAWGTGGSDSNNWIQRGRGEVQEHHIHYVGCRRLVAHQKYVASLHR